MPRASFIFNINAIYDGPHCGFFCRRVRDLGDHVPGTALQMPVSVVTDLALISGTVGAQDIKEQNKVSNLRPSAFDLNAFVIFGSYAKYDGLR